MASPRTELLLAALALTMAASTAARTASPASRLPEVIVFPPPGTHGSASEASAPSPATLDTRFQLQHRSLGRATAALRGVAARLRALLGPVDTAGNLLLSPLSVAAALGQLLLGARGETRLLLADLLDAPGPEGVVPKVSLGGEPLVPDLEYHQQFQTLLALLMAGGQGGAELRLASAFFAQRGLPLRVDFQHALGDLYRADVRSLDFRDHPQEAAAAVNEWARRATLGRIPTVLSQPLPTSTAALVASAVYFRGAWEWPFDADVTVSGWFKTGPHRRVATKFMRGNFPEMRHYNFAAVGYTLVVLPYKGGQTAMYVVLPNDKDADLREFAGTVTLEGMMEAARAARPQQVSLVLPRMNIASSFSLKEPLSNLRKLRRVPRSAPEPRSQDSMPPVAQVTVTLDSLEPSAKLSPLSRSDDEIVPVSGSVTSDNNQTWETKSDDPNSRAATSLNKPVVVGIPLRIMDVEDTYSSSKSHNNYYYEAKEPNNGKTTPVSLRDTQVPYPYSQSRKPTKATFTVKDTLASSFPKMVLGTSVNFPSEFNNSSVSGVSKAPIRPSPSSLRKMHPDVNFNDRGNCTASAEMAITDVASPYTIKTRLSTVLSVKSVGSTQQDNNSSNIAGEKQAPSNRAPETSTSDKTTNSATPVSPEATAPSPSAAPLLNPLGVGSHGVYGVAPRPLPVGSAAPYGDVDLDLTGASTSTLRVSDALHHVWLEVTETGTEAAAVTTSVVDYTNDIQVFNVDRPFLTAIVHEPSEALIFWATVADPTGGAGIRTDIPP